MGGGWDKWHKLGGSGESISKCWVSFTLHLASIGGLEGSKMLSLGSCNLKGVFRGHGQHRVEGGGDKGLWVEGGGNSFIDGGNRETGVLGPETKSISLVGDLLELAIGINIGVSTRNSSVGVADLLLD